MPPGMSPKIVPGLSIKEARVKEEPEEPREPPAEPVEVPPGVVLEKLEALLENGRVMLRYQPLNGKAWGINGNVNRQWLSFRMENNGSCQFADEEVWVTEDREGWADSELELLASLQEKVLKYPASAQPQPRAWRPRACRRAVFTFHRGKHKAPEGKAASGKAPPARAPIGKAAAPKLVPTAKVAAKVATENPAPTKVVEEIEDDGEEEAEEEAKDEVAGFVDGDAEEEDAPSAPEPPVKVAPARVQGLATRPQTPGPAAKAGGAQHQVSFQQFMASARSVMVEAGEQSKYVRLLKAVQSGAGPEVMEGLLAGYSDLAAHFLRLKGGAAGPLSRAKPSAPRQPVQAPPSLQAAGKAAQASPKTAPGTQDVTAQAAPKAQEAIDKLREEELKSLRASGAAQTHQLVKLVCGARGVRASTRMNLLRYVESKSAEQGAEKRLTILRGAPGSGKSNWALEQLRTEVGFLEGEETITQLAHVCSAGDFFTKCKGNIEQFKFEAPFSDKAHAANQARVQVAMELGLEPLYVDNANMQLWEMRGYVKMAQKAGYTVSVVAPETINAQWDDVDTLFAQDEARAETSRGLSKEQLQEMLNTYEAIPDDDPLPAILAGRCAGPKGGKQPEAEEPAALPQGLKRPAQAAGIATVEVRKVPKVIVPAAKAPLAKAPLAKAPLANAPGPRPAGQVAVKRPVAVVMRESLPMRAKAKAPPPVESWEAEAEEEVAEEELAAEEEVEEEEVPSLGDSGGGAETSFVSSFLSSLRKKPKV